MTQTITKAEAEREVVDVIASCYADPLKFVRYAYPWGQEGTALAHAKGPHPWQIEQLNRIGAEVRARGFNGSDPVEPVRMATSSGHGIGKSTECAWLIHWLMSTRPFCKGTVTSNTYQQLRTRTWAELGKWLNMAINKDWFVYSNSTSNMNIHHCDHKDTWFANAVTCDENKSEAFAGQHAADSSPWYIFDEASAIPEKIFEVAEGGLTDGEPFVFLFGNPTRNSGTFFNCFHRQKHRWITEQIDSRDVPGTNKLQIAQWIDDYGDDSDFVRVRVRGVFPRASTTQFIPTDLVRMAQVREVVEDTAAPLVIGVDVAAEGDDQTVIWPRRGLDARSFPRKQYRGLKPIEVAHRVLEEIEYFRNLGQAVNAVFVEGVGIGLGTVEHLQKSGINVIDVRPGNKSPRDGYNNLRSAMWANMRDWLDMGCIPDDPELESELTTIEYGYTLQERIQLERVKDLKSRGLPSPDNATALALTFSQPVYSRVQADMLHDFEDKDYYSSEEPDLLESIYQDDSVWQRRQ